MTTVPAKPPISWPRLLKRLARRILRLLAVVFLGLTLVLYLLQEKLIFVGASTQGTADAVVQPPPDARLLTLSTPQGERVAAVFGPAQTRTGTLAPDHAQAPTIIFFYGNAMCMNDAMEEFREFRRLGANVMVLDYLGYGMSGGKPGEAGCYAAADAAWEWLQHQPDVDGRKVIAVGWSLGAAVAVDLAARQPVAGLAMFSAFSSMKALGSHYYPYVPVGLALKHHFANVDKIPRVTCPIVIGHGVQDDIVPYAMSDKLVAAARVPVVRIRAEDTRHNDFLLNADERVCAELVKLIAQANKLPPR